MGGDQIENNTANETKSTNNSEAANSVSKTLRADAPVFTLRADAPVFKFSPPAAAPASSTLKATAPAFVPSFVHSVLPTMNTRPAANAPNATGRVETKSRSDSTHSTHSNSERPDHGRGRKESFDRQKSNHATDNSHSKADQTALRIDAKTSGREEATSVGSKNGKKDTSTVEKKENEMESVEENKKNNKGKKGNAKQSEETHTEKQAPAADDSAKDAEDDKKGRKQKQNLTVQVAASPAGATNSAAPALPATKPTGPPYKYSKEFLLQIRDTVTSVASVALNFDFGSNSTETPRGGGGNRRGGGNSNPSTPAGGRTPRKDKKRGDKEGDSRWERGMVPQSPHKPGRKNRDEPEYTIAEDQVKPLEMSEKRWVRTKPQDQRDEIFRKLKSILNKLTPEKFHSLVSQIVDLGLDTLDVMLGTAEIIYEKALGEPAFSSMYAELCQYLNEQLPTVTVPASDGTDGEVVKETAYNFKRLIVTNCQTLFENNVDVKRADFETEEEYQEAAVKARRRILGNIRFIGELFLKSMLGEKIMWFCLGHLVEAITKSGDEEQIESLCKLLATSGARLDWDPPNVQQSMNRGAMRMKSFFDTYIIPFSQNVEYPSRVRFMLQDIIDMRKNSWTGKEAFSGPKPTTLAEVHAEANRKDKDKNRTARPPRSGAATPVATPDRRAYTPGQSQDVRNDPSFGGNGGDGWESVPSRGKRTPKGRQETTSPSVNFSQKSSYAALQEGETKRRERERDEKGGARPLRRGPPAPADLEIPDDRVSDADRAAGEGEGDLTPRDSDDSMPLPSPTESIPPVDPTAYKGKVDNLVLEYMSNRDIQESMNSLKQVDAPWNSILRTAFVRCMEMKIQDQEATLGFFEGLPTILSEDELEGSLKYLLQDLGDLAIDYPSAPKRFAAILASFIIQEKASVSLFKFAPEETMVYAGKALEECYNILKAKKDETFAGDQVRAAGLDLPKYFMNISRTAFKDFK